MYGIQSLGSAPPFTIDSSSGQLTVSRPLDYETQKTHTFLVVARDSASDSRMGTATVEVNVLDVEDSMPIFVPSTYQGTVREGVKDVGVLKVHAVDADQISNIVYELVDVYYGAFKIDAQSGLIATNKPLDYETLNSYVLLVTTSDAKAQPGTLSATATVTIAVIDQNDHTPVISIAGGSSNVTKLETLPIGSLLMDLDATDGDPPNTLNSRVFFRLDKTSVSPASGADLFFVNSKTGELFLSNEFSSDPLATKYKMQIIAEDEGEPRLSSNVTVTVNVIRNKPPRFDPSTLALKIREDAGVSFRVGSVVAKEDDTVNPFDQLSYSLIGDGPALDYFSVNGGTGEISIQNALHKDTLPTFTLRIVATDGGGLSTTATVTASIERNLHPPELSKVTYTKTIFENEALSVPLVTIQAKDQDANVPHNEIAYTITGDTLAQKFFGVDNKGNIFLIKSPVEAPTVSQFNLTVNITDKGHPTSLAAQSNPAKLTITVIRNYHHPLFFKNEYKVTVPQTKPTGQLVLQVTATDDDTQGTYGKVHYDIIGDGSAVTYFEIGKSSGLINVRTDLSTTSIREFTVRVVAADGGQPPRSATALVYVTILRNFQPPVWSQQTYTSRIPETVPVLDKVLTVKAMDGDPKPPNNDVYYHLMGNVLSLFFFEIDKTKGDIKIRRPLTLDKARPNQYDFSVQATDGGTPSLTSTINIPVRIQVYRNNQAPKFSIELYQQTIHEGIKVTDSLVTVTAKDNDPDSEFSKITYSIDGPEKVLSLFSIDDNGVIRALDSAATDTINLGSETKYKIYVRAADSGNPPRYDVCLVELTVNHNLKSPVIDPLTYNETVHETLKVGEHITTIKASDADRLAPDNNVFFTLTGSAKTLEYFHINQQSGVISIKKSLLEDLSPDNTQYIMQVTATDKGFIPLTSIQMAKITINVLRNTFSPRFINTPYDVHIPRTAGKATSVVTVSAQDDDIDNPFNNITYSIASQTAERFEINSVSGEIILSQGIQSDSESAYVVTVVAKDGGKPPKSDYTMFTVTVDRNLFDPVLTLPVAPTYMNETTVLETVGFSDIIFDVDAADRDVSSPYNKLSFTIAGSGTAPTYFLINPDSGEIRLKTSLLQDSKSKYTIIVRVADQGKPARSATATATIHINVIRNHFGPQWVGLPYSKVIDENIAVGTSVFKIEAQDQDHQNTFERVSYSLLGDGNAPTYFAVDSTTGVISKKKSLSDVLDSVFFLRILALDNGVPPKTNTTVVTLTVNRNLHAPEFNQFLFEVTIDENQPVGVPFLTLNGSDADTTPPHNLFEFTIVQDGSKTLDWFSLEASTGDIAVARLLTTDHDANNTVYQFQVQIKDQGTPSRSGKQKAIVRITVIRNKHDPEFSKNPYLIAIDETQAVLSSVGRITVSDKDANAPFNTIMLRVIGDEKGPDHFQLETNGDVTVHRDLTKDTETRYTLRVEAHDGGMPPKSATALVIITVNRNLHVPEFTLDAYKQRIPETTSLGVSILQVAASDRDTLVPYNSVKYKISLEPSSDFGRQYFMIDEITGVLTARKSLRSDPAQTLDYTFSVEAIDGGGQKSTKNAFITINVFRNLHAPEFAAVDYNLEINNTHPVTSLVFDSLATDKDDHTQFNTITYRIIGDDDGQVYFSVNSVNGRVFLARSVKGIVPSEFKIRLEARDGGTPNKVAIEVLTVTIKRNFLAPNFSNSSYEKTILENHPVASKVLTVFASDGDLTSPNRDVRYYIDGTNDRFLLDAQTGVLKVRRSLVGELELYYSFKIYAEDLGVPALRSDLVQVTINVTRNLNPPVFQNEPYLSSLKADVDPGFEVARVLATDDDLKSPFNKLTYDIIGDDSAVDFFHVNSDLGLITLKQSMQSHHAENYRIRVRARDGGQPSLFDVTVVTVNVTRNLMKPSFDKTIYNPRILEIQKLGVVFENMAAHDFDTFAPNNEIEYNLTGDADCLNFFKILPSGGLYVTSDLTADIAKSTLYLCIVSAEDKGNPRLAAKNSATVSVKVIRNTAPTFMSNPYSVTIQRDIHNDGVVGVFTVRDQDRDYPFNNLTYGMIGDGNAPALFGIQGNNEVIVKNADTLAQDKEINYTVRLHVKDGGRTSLYDTAEMRINVQRNLQDPVFENSFVALNITEDFVVNGLVTKVTANDTDPMPPANEVIYSLEEPESLSAQYLHINPNTGEIRLQKSLQEKTVRQLDLLIVASDKGFPVRRAQATVRVKIIRDTETLSFNLPEYDITISENKPVGENIILVAASPGPGISYHLDGYSDAGNWFSLNSSIGWVTVKQDLRKDIAKQKVYMLKVYAEKTFTVSAQRVFTNVTIKVTRNENAPRFTTQGNVYEVTVDENMAIGSSVVNINATDDDGDRLRYDFMTESPGVTDLFYLSPPTGLLQLTKSLQDVPHRTLRFSVVVRDQTVEEKTATASVVIHIKGDDFDPYFIGAPYSASIKFNDAVGTTIIKVSADDNDKIGKMLFEARGGYLAAPGYFTVGKETGEIILLTSVASDPMTSFTLGLIAYDSARPMRSASTNITITINRNPSPPEFLTINYKEKIPETFSLGVTIVMLNATDADKHKIEFSVDSASPPSCTKFFMLYSMSGEIVLIRPLTQASFTSCRLIVIATDVANPPKKSIDQAQVLIMIDRNYYSPVFKGPYSVDIPENTTFGTSVLFVEAADDDPVGSVFSNVSYKLIGDDSTLNFFVIDSLNGSISINNDLTQENVNSYIARVVAFDGGSPAKSSTVTAVLNILRNLNKPVFDKKIYNMTIFETHPLRTIVTQVKASDADRQGPWSNIKYQMIDTSFGSIANTYFRIDPLTGEIFVRIPLTEDGSEQEIFEFGIQATDDGHPSQKSDPNAKVAIKVIRNLEAPHFQGMPYETAISFKSPMDTSVFLVNATDSDIKAPYNVVSYFLIGDGIAPLFFQVNAKTGLIKTTSSLETDTSEQYILRLVAQDGGSPHREDTATVVVNVSRNLFQPIINPQNYNINILETQRLGIAIGSIQATDGDQSPPYNKPVYKLTGNKVFKEYFKIDPDLGDIYLWKDLTLVSSGDQFEGSVAVCDAAVPPLCSNTSADITVTVTRNLHVPYFTNLPYHQDLQRSFGVGTSVLTATAQDDDDPTIAFGVIRYHLIGDEFSPDFFSISEIDGFVEISNNLAQTSKNEYQLRIQACDLGGLCNTTVATVTITTNFQPPVFVPSRYMASILETVSLGDVIVDVNATDGDLNSPNNEVRYAITDGPEDLACFTINPVSGKMTVRQSLLRDPCLENTYKMIVVANDLGKSPLRSQPAPVDIYIQRNIHPPSFQGDPFEVLIREDFSVGQVVYTVSVADADTVPPFNSIRLDIIGDDTATMYFKLNQLSNNQAEIVMKESVLNDSLTRYVVRMQAFDGGSPSKWKMSTLTVNVDRNLFAPRFESASDTVIITETQGLGISIYQLHAIDNDTKSPHQDVVYEVTGSAQASNFFGVYEDSGIIYVKQNLKDDLMKNTRFTLTLSASDLGIPPKSSSNRFTLFIDVLRNTYCPQFENLPATTTIKKTLTGFVYDVNALDSDISPDFNTDSIEYTLVGDDTAAAFFTVDSKNGYIKVFAAIVSDNLNVYRLRVEARDGGGCSTKSVLTVNVIRNLYQPVWVQTNYTETILETFEMSKPIIRVSATDQDSVATKAGRLSYALAQTSRHQDLFTMDARNGDIFLRRRLVGIPGNSFVLTLVAQDQAEPFRKSDEAQVTVNIQRNTFPPEFQNKSYSIHIDSTFPRYSSIITVTAKDNDTVPQFSEIKFKIIGDDDAVSYFSIHSTSGLITTKNDLSQINKHVFQVRVMAEDGGEPPKHSTAVVNVFINHNLFAPFFSPPMYRFEILEIQRIAKSFGLLSASDADRYPPYNEILFKIQGSSKIQDFFQVHESRGEISLKQSMLDFPDKNMSHFEFDVKATDKGMPPKNASNVARVIVSVVRNTAPYFEYTPYSIVIPSTMKGGQSVFQTTVRDNDQMAPFNNLVYSMVGDGSTTSFFAVDKSGLIKLKPDADLSMDTAITYFARIRVQDGSNPPKTATSVLSINVTRNFYDPVFKNNLIRRNIQETTEVGTVIATVNATDADKIAPNNQVKYEIVGGTGVGFFLIHPDKGNVILIKSVKAIQRFFTLMIEARDLGVPSRFSKVTLEVTILFDPTQLTFTAANYNVSISENIPVNNVITTVMAQPAVDVMYTVKGLGTAPNYFSIDKTSGDVWIKTLLISDPAQGSFYQLLVIAERNGITTQTASCVVSISVTRNEYGPVFEHTSYNLTISDTTQVGSLLQTLQATDQDGDQIEYVLVGEKPHSDFFFISPRDGALSLKKSLRETKIDQFEFSVEASDMQPQVKTSNAKIIIIIVRDMKVPEFLRLPYVVNIREDVANRSSVFNLGATDIDLVGELTFEMDGTGIAEAFFQVVPGPVANPREASVVVTAADMLYKHYSQIYMLKVVIFDSAYPETRTTTEITINVERNLNAPRFLRPRYEVTIEANQELGVPFYNISASDFDGDSVIYSIEGDNLAKQFYSIHPFTGEIFLKQSLLSGNQDTDTIQLQATDNRIPEKTGTALVLVTINRDRYAPEFLRQPYQKNIYVGDDVGITVIQLSTTDRDLRGSLMYNVIGKYPAPSFFSVHNTSGQVTISKRLTQDNLERNIYELHVSVYDDFYPENIATATVTINVNRNPSAPTCTPQAISAVLSESSPVGYVIGDVNATDSDGDVITYKIISSTQETFKYFFVDSSNGLVVLKQPLSPDFSRKLFSFSIEASDGGFPTPQVCSTGVAVSVTKDEPPYFMRLPYQRDIFEYVDVGSTVYVVSAADKDQRGSLVYSLIGDYRASYFFKVSNSTGEITVAHSIREDYFEKYTLRVTAYDSGSPAKTATATVALNVLRNLGVPAWNMPKCEATVEELTQIGTIVLNTTATDSDGDIIKYSLDDSFQTTSLKFFAVNSYTGSITITKHLTKDVQSSEQYLLKIHASDQRTNAQTATATCTINVLRNKAKPQFRNTPYRLQISENTAVNTSLLSVIAVDDDLRGKIVYEVIGENLAPYFFHIDPNPSSGGSQIVLQTSLLTVKSTSRFTLLLKAFDSVYPDDFETETVEIDVSRNEYGPVFTDSPYRAVIDEEVSIGTHVFTINATDKNINDHIQFYAVGEPETVDIFSLNPDTGSVTVAKSLTDMKKTLYKMNINATDNGIPKQWATTDAYITVMRDEFSPVFTEFYQTRIGENSAVRTDILKVRASDQDLKGVIQYVNVGQYPADSFFEIDQSSGQIVLERNLKQDYARRKQYLFIVEAYDSKRPKRRGTATVTINVIRNPTPPLWRLPFYTTTIPEDHPLFTPVINVTAEDRDPGDSIRYSIDNESVQRDMNSGPAEYFYVDTESGVIGLRKTLLGTSIRELLLIITACDDGIPQLCSNTKVRILVSTEGFAPDWKDTPYTKSVNETVNIGDVILTIKAVDRDLKPGSAVQYDFVDPRPGFFGLDERSGEIKLESSFLADIRVRYDFRVMAFDIQEPRRKAVTDVTIFVRRNVNPPTFLKQVYKETVSEYTTPGSVVVNTTAIDADGDEIRYSFLNPSASVEEKFFINSRNGIIYLKSPLEKSKTTFFNVIVSAVDQKPVNEKTSTTSVVINIDLDATPTFTLPSYNRQIEQTYPEGGLIVQTMAIDDDLKGNILYESDGVYPSEMFFAINRTTGNVHLIHSIRDDPLKLQTYKLKILAFDSEYPDRKASSQVTVSVLRHSSVPMFIPDSSYTPIVQESKPVGFQIENITVIHNTKVTYSVVHSSSDVEKYFYLDPGSGLVIIRQPLTSAKSNIYDMVVMAKDKYGVTADATVAIRISRKPADMAPFFENAPYRADILVTHAVNSQVLSVSALDPDLQETIEYRLDGVYPAPNFFKVDKATGQIVLTKRLQEDVLRTSQYTLNVLAYDTADPAVVGKTNVVITVNLNPNFPQFLDKAPYFRTVLETQALSSIVLQLNASDADGDEIQYYIKDDAEGRLAMKNFFLSGVTGIMYIHGDLRLSAPVSLIQFTVEVKDNGSPAQSSEARVVITIQRDQGPPFFSKQVYIATVTETTTVNDAKPFISVYATDRDLQGSLKYQITGDGMALAFFKIADDTGDIFVKNPLTLTTDSKIEIEVAAFDDVYPENVGKAIVQVNIIHNPNAPQFVMKSYTASLYEYTTPGTEVITVSAKDDDGDDVRYRIQSDTEVEKYFFMDDRYGIVYVKQSLHNSPRNRYSIELEALDARSPPKTGSVTLYVTILRDIAPQFIGTPYFFTAHEKDRVDKTVFTVKASDVDLQGSLRYEVVGDTPAPSFFKINSSSGVISVRSDLINCRSRDYMLRVAVYDSKTAVVKTKETVSISVVINRASPEFTQTRYDVEISGNHHVGTQVTTVLAQDTDGDKPTYSLLRESEHFLLNSLTGEVILMKSLKNVPQTQFQLRIQAVDREVLPNYGETTLTISVKQDVTHAEFLQEPYIVKDLPETTPVGTTIFNVLASDPNLQGSLTYAATGIYPAQTFFDINENDGTISIIQDLKLDGMATPTYKLEIVVFDSASQATRDTSTVTISVLRNPHAPEFDRRTYIKVISEYMNIQDIVETVRASDLDIQVSSTDQIKYDIIKSVPLSGHEFFIMSPISGEILLAKSLRTESAPSLFNLTVSANDGSANPKTATTLVVIEVVRNLHPPVFDVSQYMANASEKDPVGKVITAISAYDEDVDIEKNKYTPNAQITYSIVQNDKSGSKFFGITPLGEIFIAKPLLRRYTKGSRITFFVRATDNGWQPRFSEVPVTVDITFVDSLFGDLGFIQPQYHLELQEDTTVGSNLLQLNVVNHEKQTIICWIKSGDDAGDNGIFSVDMTSNFKDCNLTLKRPLDREVKDHYKLMIEVGSLMETAPTRTKRAAYNTWKEAEIYIYISDVNDNAPLFIFPQYPPVGYNMMTYYGAVSKFASPQEVILKLSATDPDLGPNGDVEYAMDPSLLNVPPFDVAKNTGILHTSREIYTTLTNNNQWKFDVIAKDKPVDSEPNHSKAPIIVNLIEDYNRFVIVIEHSKAGDIIARQEDIKILLQEELGYLVIIEKIHGKQTINKEENINIETDSTDIVFVLVGKEIEHEYTLLRNTDPMTKDRVMSDDTKRTLGSKLKNKLNLVIGDFRLPHPETNIVVRTMTKSYIWWLTNPWAALVAVAVMIILICIINFIVIVFSYSKYMKYVHKYNEYQMKHSNAQLHASMIQLHPDMFMTPDMYMTPDVLNHVTSCPDMLTASQEYINQTPRSYLREYEEQSLNMYVPPEYQDYDFTIDDDIPSISDPSGDATATAIVNPVYD
ncbi:uncharacterized protein LOC121378881 isoform X2 [Gigantopelta aegis]|nr:uncharacterized protein LOC121378881 isoform X2 [Gigantopelta aegis]